MKLDYIIVEDDQMASMLLERYCQKIDILECKGIFKDGFTALQFMEKEPIDLIFLDIEMPQLSGIELLNIAPIIPLTIFTTSKPNYAYQAFEFEAIDYLKKPFSFLRFQKAIEKAIKTFSQHTKIEKHSSNSIYVKDNNKFIKINLADILYFKSDADYVHIRTTSKSYTIISSLKSLEKKLPPNSFAKVHRSYIVNLSAVVDIEDCSLVIDKKVIPISRRNKNQLFKKLNIV